MSDPLGCVREQCQQTVTLVEVNTFVSRCEAYYHHVCGECFVGKHVRHVYRLSDVEVLDDYPPKKVMISYGDNHDK